MNAAWVRLHLSFLSAHSMDSMSQCVAGETATEVKERSVSNGFPTALLYMASFKLKGLYITIQSGSIHKIGFTHFNIIQS